MGALLYNGHSSYGLALSMALAKSPPGTSRLTLGAIACLPHTTEAKLLAYLAAKMVTILYIFHDVT